MKGTRIWALLVLLLLPAFFAMAGGQNEAAAGAQAATKKQGFVVALCNSFYGNSWRKQMVDIVEAAAGQAKAQGLISDFIVVNGDGTENTQIQQMNSLILQKVDLILLDSASLTGLNGTIAKAHQQGIKVLAFDSIASSPYAYKMEYEFASWGTVAGQYIVDRFKGNANVLVTRGVIGSAPETENYEAMMKVLKANPGIKILAEVDTEADIAKSQSAVANVLPSLPKVDVCAGMSADYGVVEAFLNAGRPVPVIIGSNRAEFINWWAQEKAKNGYTTISLGSEPSIGAIAVWLGIHILQGDKIPDMLTKTYEIPAVPVTNDNVDKYVPMQPGTVIAQTYDNQWVVDHILNNQ